MSFLPVTSTADVRLRGPRNQEPDAGHRHDVALSTISNRKAPRVSALWMYRRLGSVHASRRISPDFGAYDHDLVHTTLLNVDAAPPRQHAE
jgi:hypothetical protein